MKWRGLQSKDVIILCLSVFLLGVVVLHSTEPSTDGVKIDLDFIKYRIQALNSRSQDLHQTIINIRNALSGPGARQEGGKLVLGDLNPVKNDLVDGKLAPVRHVGARQPGKDAVQVLQPGPGQVDHEVGKAELFKMPSSSRVVDSVVGLNHVPNMESLNPARKVSKDRSGVSLVVGIPTVHRTKKSYLVQTIESLISNMGVFDRKDILFVILVADIDAAKVDAIFKEVQSKYQQELDSGLIEIISSSPAFYPDFVQMDVTFGDPKDRFIWRTKQVFDFAYLMMYARSRGLYYLQVEDDIQARPNYAAHIAERAKKDTTWDVLEFTALGFIGKLFRCADLTDFIHFFLANAQFKPVDWLLDDWFFVRYCHPEKDYKDCRTRKKAHRVLFKPALFQHIGHFSSLDGKIQKLTDRTFKQQKLPPLHTNPASVVSSSIKFFQTYSPEGAYLQTGFFWGMAQSAGDRITFTFGSPVVLTRVFIQSGNTDHPGDIFSQSAQLEYLTYDSNNKNPTEQNWHKLCSPVAGTFDCKFPKKEELRALSLHFTVDSKQWILMPSVFLYVA